MCFNSALGQLMLSGGHDALYPGGPIRLQELPRGSL
jgi:hypothetical protein